MNRVRSVLAVLLLAIWAAATAETTTSFHYAGTLTDTQSPAATGNYDIRVRLFDGAGAGASQLGSDVLLPAVQVTLGFFAIDVDFGTAILAPQSWLEFAVQPTGTVGYQTLAPRQQIGHVPFALYAEGTDWSGIANVPANVLALTDQLPPAIGYIATTPQLAGANSGPSQLTVRQIQFTASRPVNSGVPGAVAANDVELWLEPTQALPSIMTAIDANTLFTLTLTLNFTGSPIASFTNALFDSVELEPAPDASGTNLMRVRFKAGSVTITSPSALTFTYNVQTGTPGAMPAGCPAFLSSLGYGAIPGDFVGLTTISKPSVLSIARPTTLPVFALPEFSVALTPATATASADLVVCGFALVASNQVLSPNPKWSQFPAGAKGALAWSTQASWTSVYVSGFGLNSDNGGNVSLSWEFTPGQNYKVTTQDPAMANTYVSCWNVATHTPC